MPKPPSSSATPRPVELLARLTTLSQELAGAFRPATVVEVVARTLEELLKPDRLSFVLLDAQTNQLAVTHDTSAVPVRTDDPLLQLALRRGPLAFGRNVKEEARHRGAALTDEPPGSWIGVPLVAAGRAVGAVSLASDRADPVLHGESHGRRALRRHRDRGPDGATPAAGAADTV